MFNKKVTANLVLGAALLAPAALIAADFGAEREASLKQHSNELFGFGTPLDSSADFAGYTGRTSSQVPGDLITLAGGLQMEFLTRAAANKTDMMSLWPHESASATHLITCVEGGAESNLGGNADKYNPSVQRINLSTGAVETILRGMNRCDGIRTTAWGTVLATEEAGDGQAYEILEPLTTTNHTVTDRVAGTIVDGIGSVVASTKAVKHDAMMTMSWEGLTITDSGVVIGGDELRPGTAAADVDGGAIFKFVPSVAFTGSSAITDLSQSPFTAGSTYAMRVNCKTPPNQYGQGCEIGSAEWVSVTASTARLDADAVGATGYYRPEDLHADPTYTGPGVRFCWANTGHKSSKNYGEVICGVDTDPYDMDYVTNGYPHVNRFVEGDTELNAPDNLAFQAVSGNLYVIEDNAGTADVWACLKDSADRDIKTDGCVRLLSLFDSSAEPTGFMFSADGQTAYVVIQHSDDASAADLDNDDYPTDDIIKITGFADPATLQ